MLHVPHSGTVIPADVRSNIVLNDQDLRHELAVMTDWFTDIIAREAVSSSGIDARLFINQLSRLVVDPERFPDDREAMADVGMGAVYQRTSGQFPLRTPHTERDQDLLKRFFHPYAEALEGEVARVLEDLGSVVIVDVHSFASTALPYELNQAAARPAVCLGADDFHTSKDLLDLARVAFAVLPGGLEINTPFAGTYVPLRFFESDRRVQSVMIEIRRDVYMDEVQVSPHSGLDAVVSCLAAFLTSLDQTDRKR